VGRRKVRLRKPRKTNGSGGGGSADPDRHIGKSTEERVVDLFRMYVLEPDGIEITDQRLRARVGADLVGNDNVFRELKARSGSDADKVELTPHEYVRADQARESHELVIVEHVLDDPVITVIRDPLGRLEYYPVGDIVVEGWRELDPQPQIVRMTKTEMNR
jgi:hypothetical protein